jgi:hypothetical protein
MVCWLGGGGCCHSGCTRIGQKNTLFTPGAHIDLVLRCAWFCCIKFKVSRVRYHSGGSMKLNTCILILAHMVYL